MNLSYLSLPMHRVFFQANPNRSGVTGVVHVFWGRYLVLRVERVGISCCVHQCVAAFSLEGEVSIETRCL